MALTTVLRTNVLHCDIVNRQIGVADSKYVISDDPLPPGHLTARMRIANFAGPFTLLSAITQQRIKIED